MDPIPCCIADTEIQALLAYEAQLLNESRFDEWLGLYTDDAVVWVPARTDQTDPDEHVSLFYDDRELLELRVKRLGHPLLHSQDPMTRTVRLVGNSTLSGPLAPDAEEAEVRSSFILLDYRRHLHRFYGGTYEHRLRRSAGAWRIAAKTVRLINCDDYHSNFGLPI